MALSIASLMLLASSVTAQAIMPPNGTLTMLNAATDERFGGFISDAGAGGFVQEWGMSLFSISDGSLASPDHFKNASTGVSLNVHTGYAVFDNTDPTKLTIIGDYYGKQHARDSQYLPGNGSFWAGQGGEGLVPFIESVDSLSGIMAAGNFGPAPHTAAIPIPGNSSGMLNVWPVHNDISAYHQPYVFTTMFEMDFPVDADYLNDYYKIQVPVDRIVPCLFNVTANITGYGSSMLTSGRGDEADTHFYLWEGDSTGWKLARAPWNSRTDTSTYDFWHGNGSEADMRTGWVKNAPLHRDTDMYGNIFNFSSTGYDSIGSWGADIRWVDRFQTYVITFMAHPFYGADLFVQYSETGDITGPYTEPVGLFLPLQDSRCDQIGAGDGTDFIQLHWDYYGLNANQTLMSWISCTNFQNLGIINWNTGYDNYSSPYQSYTGP